MHVTLTSYHSKDLSNKGRFKISFNNCILFSNNLCVIRIITIAAAAAVVVIAAS